MEAPKLFDELDFKAEEFHYTSKVKREHCGKTLDVGEDSPIKSYRMNIKYFTRGSTAENRTWFKMQEGSFANCTERYGGYSVISASPGSLELRLEVCRARQGD